MNGTHALTKEAQELMCHLPWEDTVSMNQEWTLADTKPAGALVLHFQPPEL